MRIVRWESQERVDLPDMEAQSFLVLGEFRRLNRELIVGKDPLGAPDAKFVIRGFAVEPSAVPDSRIRIRADDGATTDGVFYSPENLGANNDGGNLTGGRDQVGNLEGAAQQIIDFAALPAATYVIEVRFTYGQGANDNRAFWNPGVDSEFIAAMDTRHEPQWTAQAVGGATGGEWLVLGTVTWDGVGPITTSEITDLRRLLFEGLTPFQEVDQDDLSYSAPDFSRSTARGDKAVTIDTVVAAIRACFRQIRDIKGPDDSGQWNWWNRPTAPKVYDGGALPFGAQHTKTLRSVDTVTYTIGDGVSTFGDFNGVTALEDALDRLHGSAGLTRPRRCKIIMKSSRRTPSITYVVAPSYDFTADGDLELEIECVTADGAEGSDRGRAVIEFNGGLGGINGYAISINKLVLKNLDVTQTAANASLFATEKCEIYNTALAIQFDAANLVNSRFALQISRTPGDAFFFCKNVSFNGPVQVISGSIAPISRFNKGHHGVFESCLCSYPVLLTDRVTAFDRLGITFRGCTFSELLTLSGSRGLIDGRGSQNVVVQDCQFTLGNRNQDCIFLGELAATKPVAFWRIENNEFNISDTARAELVDGGQNGVAGTGWAVFLQATSTPAGGDLDEHVANIIIRNNYVEGPNTVQTNFDSGGIYLEGVKQAIIEGNHFWEFGVNTTSRVQFIKILDVPTQGSIVVRSNYVDKLIAGTGHYTGIDVFDSDHVHIEGNHLVGLSNIGAVINMDETISAAIDVRSSDYTRIIGNHIAGWDSEQVVSFERLVGSGCAFFAVIGNTFRNPASTTVGMWAIDCETGVVSDGVINDNVFLLGAQGGAINVRSTANMVVNGNRIDGSASAAANAIDWSTTSVDGMCSGNSVQGQIINAAGSAATIFGVPASAYAGATLNYEY